MILDSHDGEHKVTGPIIIYQVDASLQIWNSHIIFMSPERTNESEMGCLASLLLQWRVLNFWGFVLGMALVCRMWVQGSPGGASGEEPACQCRRSKRHGFDSWVGQIPWRRAWQPTPIFLPGESHWQRSLVGCSPWGCKESGLTEVT